MAEIMDQNQTQTSENEFGCFAGFIILVLVLVMLVAGWRYYAHSRKFNDCVQLENGLNLGFNALFDLRETFWLPRATLKFNDGTPMIEHPLGPTYITKAAVYVQVHVAPNIGYDYFWRADLGIIKASDDYDAHNKLVSEAGPANTGVGTGAYGPEVLMLEMMKQPQYANQTCTTKLFAW